MNKKEFMKLYSGREFIQCLANLSLSEEDLAVKLPHERVGIITFRSKDYIFRYDGKISYGDIPPSGQFGEDSFYVKTPFGRITYTLKRGEK